MHPDIPEEISGTYSANSHPVTIKYLKELGTTTIELLPLSWLDWGKADQQLSPSQNY
jgi:pullulanase/glycogen debranching enzyme